MASTGTPKQQTWEQQQSQVQKVKSSGVNMINGSPTDDYKEEEMTESALALFRAKEEEIERKKMEVRDRVQAYMGRVEEATRRLADIREELDALIDPMRKEVAVLRKKVDTVNRELKPLGQTCQKKEREYKEALETVNEKEKEKAQLVSKLMELVSESERLRMKKLEELSRNIETLH
ncbi:putative LURP-one-related 8 [Hibiscus syriacus]|uniref:RAB6-interacting golgin n=1 Tax=Hibiscus syriacus TaxID=106335 RepID=A0A6A3B2Z2_HIBSY|nr:probable DNA double-strand break repair Rad50 ATPase [Hibiscus syriacus]KAE8711374.1 putative LURP-one-related 8 [Hibiscus syriacus]